MSTNDQTVEQPIEEPIEGGDVQELETPEGDATETQQTQFVTQDQIGDLADDIVRRLKQSDKSRQDAIKGRLSEITTLLTNAGKAPTEEETKAFEAQITREYEAYEANMNMPQQPQGQPTLDTWLQDVFSKAGQQVGPNDPEWKALQETIDKTWDDPNGMTQVLVAATTASTMKKSRVAKMQESAANRGGIDRTIQGEPSARKTASELWKDAYS